MALPDVRPLGNLAPVASVWCRQVDNEAESPGYTTIPDDFPGRRETLEAIRIVGNLTVNVADTHDYWDPDPSQPLSFYPNLFLYPAANGRYTCIGRMFLSTEDRPRLGMKTLVFETDALTSTGDFGGAVVRAHGTMGAKAAPAKPAAEPDPAVYQAVGEGFLFHRGTTEPVVIVAAEQWEAASQVVLDLVRSLPASLVGLGAFLSFPYFLPAAKVNLHEFTEQIPLALALMRVPRGEAQGDRHTKRIQSWEAAPVSLRDLTKPAGGKSKDTLPLLLQYARDGAEEKLGEVARRVDAVEGARVRAHLQDAERQAGRERRKEMWRIATAMETAALLQTRPKGRGVAMTGEAARRANEYLKAQPGESPILAPPAPLPPAPPVATAPATVTPPKVPAWLQRPAEVVVPPTTGPTPVPLSTSDDMSLRPGVAPAAPSAAPAPVAAVADPGLEDRLKKMIDQRFAELARTPAASPSTPEPATLDARIAAATRETEARWAVTLEARARELQEASQKSVALAAHDLASRIATVEARPIVSPAAVADDAAARARVALEPKLAAFEETVRQTVQTSGEMWAERLREELKRTTDEISGLTARAEEDLRTAVVAQLDLEVRELQEQGTALREEVEGRVRDLLAARATEAEQHRAKELRELEQRWTVLIDGRSKDLENRMLAALSDQKTKTAVAAEERLGQAERRFAVEREARIAEVSEAQSQAIAGLQVRLQSYFEQKLRENQEKEREKYVELLARLKSEVDQSLARTIDSSQFDAAVRERVGRSLELFRPDQEKSFASFLADAELKLRTQAEEASARLERTVHGEVVDIDRRLQVLSDRMLPLVRRTWLKVAELEKVHSVPEETEARYKELRREMSRELRRIEGELLEQTSDLRDRLETSIASQGRIWLNLLRQLSAEGEAIVPHPSTRSPRRPARPAEDEVLGDDLRATAAVGAFENDPPNPMDPEPALEATTDRDARRRPRRT